MRAEIILDCCSYEVKTTSKTYEYIDCFKLKPGKKFFKKYLPDGREIKREIMLVSVCPNCKHWVLKFLWYARKNGRFQDWDDSKIVRGKQADEIFERRNELYNLVDLPNPFKPKANPKHSKKIPWVYFKMLPEQQAQIPRYFDESGDAGLKIVIPTKTYKI
jgi:hypothetical protein